MKTEFKHGDKAMIEVNIESILLDNNGYAISIPAGRFKEFFHINKDAPIHPIPTPPRPLRVDELEAANEYEWDDCGRRQKGIFRTNVGKFAIMEIPIGDDDYYVTPVLESLNIRPVERAVSKEEVYDYFTTYRRKTADLFPECIFETVRHFMKGGLQ